MNKISVIVPVYKVENYLQKCLESIVTQTYDNLEIILIDDGSPDGCGAVCDGYAARDPRILVVHQENKGLSAARNAGLELATGDWIGFVDSDDWLEPDLYEYLLSHALQYDADIAVCGRIDEYADHSKVESMERLQHVSRHDALGLLFQDTLLQSHVWDKLFRRYLFRDIRFPVGRCYEDVAVMYRLFAAANSLVLLPEAKYHYLQRIGSTVNSLSFRAEVDLVIAFMERFQTLSDTYPQHAIRNLQVIAEHALNVWKRYCREDPKDRSYAKEHTDEISAFVRRWVFSPTEGVFRRLHLGLSGRAILRLCRFSGHVAFLLSYLIDCLYRLCRGKNTPMPEKTSD